MYPKILLPLLAALLLILFSACDSSDSDSDSSSDTSAYAGVWFLYVAAETEPALYVILDSSGGVTAAANFFNDGGTYSVEANGDFELTLAVTGAHDSTPVEFTGNFSSNSAGTFSGPATGTMNKISDPDAAAGNYTPAMVYTDGGTENVALDFTIGTGGAITAGSGTGDETITTITGYGFLDSGDFIMHAVTDAGTRKWKEMTLVGTTDAGSFELETNSGSGAYTGGDTLLAPAGSN